MAPPQTIAAPSFWGAWRWWLPPSILALGLVSYFTDPFIGDWDGFDYTMLSLAGYPSSMALGRNLFIFGNHALYSISHLFLGLQPQNAYLLFKYAVVAQAALTTISCWLLARQFTWSLYSATVAALIVALSPVFILYGGQVMTDVPSMLAVSAALIVHFRGVQQRRIGMLMLGAVLLGLGVNLRETTGFYAPWLVLAPLVCGWRLRGRDLLYIVGSCLLFLFVAFGAFSFWFLTDAHYRRIWFGWRESMDSEAARHPVTLRNIRPYLTFFCVTAPMVFVTLPLALVKEWRQRGLSSLLLLALVGLFANLVLFFNYSTAVNWRYFLTGLPALAPLAANYLVNSLSMVFRSIRVAFVACLAILGAISIVFGIYMRPVSQEFIERRALSKDYYLQLHNVPRDAVMISGAQTIAVIYWKAIGLGEWQTIGTGGGWPGDQFISVVENHLEHGRHVFLDSDPRWWMPCRWQLEEILGLTSLENHFRFRRVTDTIYEVRPIEDITATDLPHLQRLLPENRPEDIRKCYGGWL